MQNRRRGLWILITITMILLMVNPKTVKYLKAKTNLDQGGTTIVKEIETPHSSQIIYEKLDNGLIKYWEGILIYYNMAGEQMWSVNLGINRPIIKTNSNSIYIIDENTNQIMRINNKGEQVYKSTLDKPYKNFNICDNNYVVLHHNINGPIQYITIINEEGKKSSEITLGEVEITNVAISKAYDRIAISTIGVNGDSLENNVLIYDLKANLLSSEGLKNNIVLSVFYNEKGDLIVIDEKNIFSINKNNQINWETNFNSSITLVDTKNKGFITIYREGSSKNSIIHSRAENKIQTISYDGKTINEISLNEKIIGLDNYKNDILAYSLRTIFRHNKNGNMKAEYPYSSDILKSFALSDNNIVVITKEKTTFLLFK